MAVKPRFINNTGIYDPVLIDHSLFCSIAVICV